MQSLGSAIELRTATTSSRKRRFGTWQSARSSRLCPDSKLSWSNSVCPPNEAVTLRPLLMPTTQSLEPTTLNPKQDMPIWKAWWLAARPKTLPAAIAPVIAGSAVAIHERGFFLPAAIAALITALLLQIAANFANDAIDFKKGADTAERAGPTRVTSGGLLSADTVLKATGIVLVLAAICGLYLVWRAGWPFLLLGLAAIVCAVAYSGGPFPISYLGLGELFVFLFFGLLAVAGTAYVQTL